MDLREYIKKEKEKKMKEKELMEQAKSDETVWLKLYYNNSIKDTGVIFITPIQYDFETETSSYRFDPAAERLSTRLFKKDLFNEVARTDIPWRTLVSKVYNTIVIELDGLNSNITMSVPSDLSDFQIKKLQEFQEKVNAFKEQGIPYKIKIGARTQTYQSVDEILKEYYHIDTSNILKLK